MIEFCSKHVKKLQWAVYILFIVVVWSLPLWKLALAVGLLVIYACLHYLEGSDKGFQYLEDHYKKYHNI